MKSYAILTDIYRSQNISVNSSLSDSSKAEITTFTPCTPSDHYPVMTEVEYNTVMNKRK